MSIAAQAKTKKKNRIHQSFGSRAFDVFNVIFMFLFLLVTLYPFWYVVIGSFSDGADYMRGGVYLWPREWSLQNYQVTLVDSRLWIGFRVTIARTFICTITHVLFTAMVAYAMSRSDLPCRKFIYWFNMFTMFFGGGLVPYFLIIKSIGLYNNYLVYIIPSLYSVYNMIVIQSGFKSISEEIHDAAFVDGAGELRIWLMIYLPLSKPVLATVALWLAIGHWNSYFDCMIYTNSESLQTLQYFLLKAIQTSSMTEGMPPDMMERLSPKTVSLATIIVSIIPVLFFFPFIRKNFASGIMIGSLKG